MKNKPVKLVSVLGIILLFIVSVLTPMVIGYNVGTADKEQDETTESDIAFYSFDKYYFPETYLPEKRILEVPTDNVKSEVSADPKDTSVLSLIETGEEPLQTATSGGPMDSTWPMYCHDTHHTGRSPYSTADNPGVEKWRFYCDDYVQGGAVIDNEDNIYFGSWEDFYALYPNGTMKWKYPLNHWIESSPAIDENGVVYVGVSFFWDGLYAFNPNGTLKWKYKAGGIHSSPAIGNDSTVYFGTKDDLYPTKGSIYALYPNGTLRWRYQTNHVIYSSPAIGEDGTVYCGCHDTYLYALYPNNGTLKWRYKTGHWIRVSPCIADDGTIYVVSLDNYLHAVRPNGTLKWKTNVGAGTSPTIGQDGTVYAGYSKLYAVNPNGSVKWTFDNSGNIRGGTPANSIDGTVYFGTDNGYIYAVYPNGTLRWREHIGECEFAPAIGEDGTVYVGSTWCVNGKDFGYLHAFGRGPLIPDANGPYSGYVNQTVQFTGTHFGGIPPYTYRWDFGDTENSSEKNPTHTYTQIGEYIATFTVTDNESNVSSDNATVTISFAPPGKPSINGPTRDKVGEQHEYKFKSIDPDGADVSYYVEWGDDTNSGWVGPFGSGVEITLNHTWSERGTYTIRAKAKNTHDLMSGWGTLSVRMPRNILFGSLFLQLLERLIERFPNAFPILRHLLGL